MSSPRVPVTMRLESRRDDEDDTERNRHRTNRGKKSLNGFEVERHAHALACFVAALESLVARKQIGRELLERIFDRAEELSLDGETPTPATRVIRDAWDRIERGVAG